jgi:pilus assembly protein CpaE
MLNKLFNRKKETEVKAPITSAAADESSLSPLLNKPPAPVVAVLGAKGGVGTSSIAVNLAAALSISGIKTTLLDAVVQQPDAAQLLGAEPEHSLMELLNRMPFPDQQLYEACCFTVAGSGNNLNLLSPPLSGEAGLKANLTQIAECLKLIRCYADFWVIDLPHYLDKHFVNLVDMCNKILLVFEPTVSGVAASRRWLNIFKDLGYDSDRIVCILNRAGSKYTLVEQQLDTCFADKSIVHLPNASASALECSSTGIPMVIAHPKHAYARAMSKLALAINPYQAPLSQPLTPSEVLNVQTA